MADLTYEPGGAPYQEWLDADQNLLLTLGGAREEGWTGVTDEGEPTLAPAGQVETVPGTGVRLYVGGDALVPDDYSVTVAVQGRDGRLTPVLQALVVQAARQTRYVRKRLGEQQGLLPVARFTRIARGRRADPRLPREVKVTFAPALAYWLTEWREEEVSPGAPRLLYVAGEAPAPLRIRITAGASAVDHPSVRTDAGVTTWLGTLQPGQTLDIDASPGRWAATVGGVDVRLGLTGPQPLLNPGEREVTVTAPGASAVIGWQEGVL